MRDFQTTGIVEIPHNALSGPKFGTGSKVEVKQLEMNCDPRYLDDVLQHIRMKSILRVERVKFDGHEMAWIYELTLYGRLSSSRITVRERDLKRVCGRQSEVRV